MFGQWLVVACLLVVTTWHLVLGTPNITIMSGSDEVDDASRSLASKSSILTKRDQCGPQKILVTVKKDTFPGRFSYKMEVKHPRACEESDDLIELKTEDGNYQTIMLFQIEGDYCYTKKGSYVLSYGGVKSNSFNLSGLDLIYDEFFFRNDSEAQVKFQKLPQWAKEVKIELVDMKGTTVGNVTTQETLIIIPGNYTMNNKYFLWYFVVVNQPPNLNCQIKNNGHLGGNPYVYYKQTKRRSEPDHNQTVLIVIGLLAVFCLSICVVATITLFHHTNACCRLINILSCHHNEGSTRSRSYSDTPFISSPTDPVKIVTVQNTCVANVLLVHAGDNPHLTLNLKEAITKYCTRKILDITQMDIQRLECPETWLQKVLCQQDNTVVVVMSPALAALYRSLQVNCNGADKVVVTTVTGKMRCWDKILLPLCLQLLEEHLSQNYSRLFVAKLENCSHEEDIPDLVPSKRFLYPQHRMQLMKALGSHC